MKKKRDFLSSADLSRASFDKIINKAEELKLNRKEHFRSLKNKIGGVFTTKPSLRTRISFEVALIELGAKVLFLKDEEIGLGTRESYADVGNVISRYLDLFIVRSNDQRGLKELAECSSIPVVNALTDKEHPCQALADLLTIKEKFSILEGLKLTYVGDGNNVANSLMLSSAINGMEFTLICPQGYEPEKYYVEKAEKLAEKNKSPKPVISNDMKLCKKADVLYTDVWVSMGQAKDIRSVKEDFSKYQLNSEALGGKNIPVLHCLPAHKGEEISSELFEKNSALIFEQAENRLHGQKAILEYVCMKLED